MNEETPQDSKVAVYFAEDVEAGGRDFLIVFDVSDKPVIIETKILSMAGRDAIPVDDRWLAAQARQLRRVFVVFDEAEDWPGRVQEGDGKP